MRGLQGTGWLLVGIFIGVLVPSTGAHRWLVTVLAGLLPLPWAAILVGALLFGTCAGLYFRAHWIAAARAHRESVYDAADAGHRFERLSDEIERAAFLIGDNLREVSSCGEPRRQMYLEGALAHVHRLRSLAQRCRGLASRLRSGDGTVGTESDEHE